MIVSIGVFLSITHDFPGLEKDLDLTWASVNISLDHSFSSLTCLLAFLSLFCFVPWYIMIWKKQILFFSNPNLKFSEIQNFHVWVLNMHQSAAYLGTKKISSSLSPMFPHGGNEGIGCVTFQAFILYY